MTASIIGQGTSSPIPPLKYEQFAWGDFIEGTKEQFQALGLGIGLVFPGEDGGPKRTLKTRDPLGHEVEISDDGRGRFHGYREFVGWPANPLTLRSGWVESHPGVKWDSYSTYFDRYVGSAADLEAAGLVMDGQFPGQPGRGKVMVTIRSDAAGGAGTLSIKRRSKSTFEVNMQVNAEESRKRLEAVDRAVCDWKQKVRTLPRPAPLRLLSRDGVGAARQRGHLRLVWSAPDNRTSERRYTL